MTCSLAVTPVWDITLEWKKLKIKKKKKPEQNSYLLMLLRATTLAAEIKESFSTEV